MTYFLHQGYITYTFPNCTSSWRLGVQRTKSMGDISHSTHHNWLLKSSIVKEAFVCWWRKSPASRVFSHNFPIEGKSGVVPKLHFQWLICTFLPVAFEVPSAASRYVWWRGAQIRSVLGKDCHNLLFPSFVCKKNA